MSQQKTRSEDLAAALRRRFRTGPSRSSSGSLSSLGVEAKSRDQKSLAEEEDVIPEYNPDSSEPRYLQMAKAELRRRKDLRCGDCGFMGLPSPDQKCPDCGGPMEEPQAVQSSPAMSTEEIRKAIRAQWAQKQGVRESNDGYPYQDENGITHDRCHVCNDPVSTHDHAGALSLDYCGDCGKPTCSDHRSDDRSSKCTKCQTKK